VVLDRVGPSFWHRQTMPLLGGLAFVVFALVVFALGGLRRRT
jgi:uncharacterized membrane protein